MLSITDAQGSHLRLWAREMTYRSPCFNGSKEVDTSVTVISESKTFKILDIKETISNLWELLNEFSLAYTPSLAQNKRNNVLLKILYHPLR